MSCYRSSVAAGVVVCGLVLAGCASGKGSSGNSDAAALSPGVTDLPSIALTDPGDVAGSQAPAAGDERACHKLFDPEPGSSLPLGLVDSIIVGATLTSGGVSPSEVDSYVASLQAVTPVASVNMKVPLTQMIFDVQLGAIGGKVDVTKLSTDRQQMASLCTQYPGVVQYTPPA